MGYAADEEMVRVDLFKDTGKWYTTVAIKWGDYTGYDLRSILKKLVNEQHIGYSGMYAVCLKPYSEFSHPIMVKL